jgi:hypothetical protein
VDLLECDQGGVRAGSYSIKGRQVSGVQLLLDEPGDVVIETGVDLALVEKIKEIIADFLKSDRYQRPAGAQPGCLAAGCGEPPPAGQGPAIVGIDGFEEALQQILNSSNGIYTGRDDLFGQLVDYYCNQDKLIKCKCKRPAAPHLLRR